MDEYIIHGTLYKNLIKILKEGCINNNLEKRTIIKENIRQIFSQLVYKDIPYENNQIPFWFDAGIVLKNEILKDFPFYATSVGNFQLRFKNGLNKSNSIIFGNGKLLRYPNLKKLKEIINNHQIPNLPDNSLTFMHSHEILFGRKIPLKKYCKCIVIYKNNNSEKKIQKLCDKLNIPLKIIDKSGINNLINVINS